jgi:hypothetical protein
LAFIREMRFYRFPLPAKNKAELGEESNSMSRFHGGLGQFYKTSHQVSLFVIFLYCFLLISCQRRPPAITQNQEATKTEAPTSSSLQDPAPSSPSPIGEAIAWKTPTPTLPSASVHPRGTPAGAGILTDQVGDPIEYLTGNFLPLGYAWYQPIGQDFLLVYAGEDAHDPQQGVVIVLRSGTIWHPIGSRHETERKAGGLLILGAQDQRLILQSTSGDTFYFDIPAGRFVESLAQAVPTMTPGPTTTPVPPSDSIVKDDAPDFPGLAVVEQPLNIDLPFFIDPQGDEDWHLFHINTQGDLEISLTHLPAPYAIEVYRIQDLVKVGSLTVPTIEDKYILLPSSLPGDYLIRVWGIDGAWDGDVPYHLIVQVKP